MPEQQDLYEELKKADQSDQIGYARYLCEQFLKENPTHALTLVRYANNLISLAQYQKAKDALDLAETVAPKELLQFVLSQRGHLLEAQGQFAAAEKAFEAAHQLDPDDATYLIFAGSAAFRRGDIEKAGNYAEKATQCREGCIDEAYFNLGGYLLSSQRYQEAADCYRKALELDPQDALARERLNDV